MHVYPGSDVADGGARVHPFSGHAWRRSWIGLAVLGPLVAAIGWAAEPERPSGMGVMGYLAQRASRMAAELPPMPAERAAWEKRRESLRRQVTRALGLPAREPMRAKTIASRTQGDLVIEDVMYLWAERAYVSANVVRPAPSAKAQDKSPRLPALVMPPGWLGELGQECYSTFVHHMARKGCLVIFIDDPHVGKRVAPFAGLYGAAAAAGTQVMGIQVFDTLRALDYLLARADVDPGRIGVVGLCQGSEQTWLAAAVDERFQIAVPVCGTTTYEGWARMPFDVPHDLSDPSPYVTSILRFTDWHEINACIAPRAVFIASNSGDIWWPKAGYDKVVETLDHAFKLYGQPERFRHLRELRSHSLTPFIPELAPWIDEQLRALPASTGTRPQPCGEPVEPDFSMLRWCQRRIVLQSEALPRSFAEEPAWRAYRGRLIDWLRQACDMQGFQPGPARNVQRSTTNGLTRESVELAQAPGLSVPALVLSPALPASARRAAIVVSHDNAQAIADPQVEKMAGALAADGYAVCIPEHVSTHPASLRRLPHFISLYGAGDTVGLPPLALRVWDTLGAVRCLRERADVDPGRIAVIGLGVGGVDAVIAAALDEQVAACGVVGAITVRDWAEHVARGVHLFDRILPYLPDLARQADLDYIYSAMAPRPLLLLDATDRAAWPEVGFRRVRRMAEHVYGLGRAPKALTAAPARSGGGLEEIRAWIGVVLPVNRERP